MDVALFTVTVISLVMAFAMGIVTWRLLREERRRSDARVASLMAELEQSRAGRPASASPTRRAAAPSATARAPVASRHTTPPPRARVDRDTLAVPATRTAIGGGSTGLFARATDAAPAAHRWLVATGAVALVLAAGVVGALWPSSVPGADTGTAVPVELLSLVHSRDGDYLAITGSVRNPSDGIERAQMSVAATVFDGAGEVVGAGQTPLPVGVLEPGSETPFQISLPDADRINRYRISFMQAQTSVPHVDRREPGDQTRAGGALEAGGQP